jgi:hypothetical protein
MPLDHAGDHHIGEALTGEALVKLKPVRLCLLHASSLVNAGHVAD